MNIVATQHPLFVSLLIWAAAYLLAISFSGVVVKLLFRLAKIESNAGNDRAGRVIGKIEDVLVVTLVAAGAYPALALIIAAKSIARVDHHKPEQASYYILGTLGNFTWALLVALVAKLTLLYLGLSLPISTVSQVD
jgi:uncharacterized membrane protein